MAKDYVYEKDYCSLFPESYRGTYIGGCCKGHDNDVGQKGTYNPIMPHITFFRCLNKRINTIAAIGISIMGAIFSWVKLPWLYYKIYKYRKTTTEMK